jgi:Ca2+/Na+ antiporter
MEKNITIVFLIFTLYILFSLCNLNNDIKLILLLSIGIGLYYYNYKYKQYETNEEINNPNETKIDKENKTEKKTRHVRFNENIEYHNTDNYETLNNIDELIDLALIADNLLDNNNKNINKNINKNKNISVASTDREKMFLELENEIDNQYKTFNAGGYNTIEIPLMNDLIVNSNKIKNSDINPVINPNVYNIQPDDNLTIWEHYDKVTTNNYKQFVNMDEVNPNTLTDAFMLGKNSNYGATKFDTYSI